MLSWFNNIDALLRGDLRKDGQGAEGQIDFPVVRVVLLSIFLASIFGASIGSFSAVSARETRDGWMQLLASTVKTPFLFYLTLFVTFPSLYVFNALMGSRLNMLAALRLLIASIAVMVAVLASVGPIIVFFAFSTPGGRAGHRFILLLVVALCTVAGILGLGYLLKMLKRFTLFGEHATAIDAPPNRDDNSQEKIAPEMVPPIGLGRPAQSTSYTIFRVWVFVFAVVGAQMSWVLRPFIGSPDLEFSWFRERSGNFFQTVFVMLFRLFSGDY
jgi:hypothetical protein